MLPFVWSQCKLKAGKLARCSCAAAAATMETPRDTPREVMESARESRRAPLHEKVKANKALEQMKALPS